MTKDRDQRPAFNEAAPLLSRVCLRLGGELPRVSRQIFSVPFGTPILRAEHPAPVAHASHRWRTVAALVALVLSAAALLLSLWKRL